MLISLRDLLVKWLSTTGDPVGVGMGISVVAALLLLGVPAAMFAMWRVRKSHRDAGSPTGGNVIAAEVATMAVLAIVWLAAIGWFSFAAWVMSIQRYMM